MQIEGDDERYLTASMAAAEIVLILGAGASVSSRNRHNEPVKASGALARLIAERAGLPYEGEKLSEVLGACSTFLSDRQIRDILVQEYVGITPSRELEKLFTYTWKRLYTWNIDDALHNTRGVFSQKRRFYNGLIDKAAEFEGINQLHIVQLHGDITKADHGLIMTEIDYAQNIQSEKHFWYQRAAQDYLAFCPVFIGSALDEPILLAELERAKRDQNSNLGRGYVITPDDLSPIKKGHLSARGIIHIKGTLEDFSSWLMRRMPHGRSAQEVISATSHIPEEALAGLSKDDLVAAQSIRQVEPSRLRALVGQMSATALAMSARQFLRGAPPTWRIAASTIPVQLEACGALLKALEASIAQHDRIFVVAGQAGSGKTTAVQMTLLKYAEIHKDVDLFELSSDVRSIKTALSLLKRVSTRRTILYVGDLLVYGDTFPEDLELLAGSEVTVVTTTRSGEWKERFARHFPSIIPFSFQRFVRNDYDPLIKRLLDYVPSPRFRRMSRNEQYLALSRSNSQLLIALREATESENFSDIITNEFEKLPDTDTRLLLLIVGIATMARVGISREMAAEAYSALRPKRTLSSAIDALDGIVLPSDNRRLFARHELYVRHIMENVARISDFTNVIKSILRTFVKYDIPIVRSVNRLDAQLFRFLLNHDFVFGQSHRHHDTALGRSIYEEFEVEFQLDGHYWLQYGLFLAEDGDLEGSLSMLRRSVQAYPDNPYVLNALADVQLQVAAKRKSYDTITRSLIDEAVKTLKIQDASRVETDVYPIVTLAHGHLNALIVHKQDKEARSAAVQYFDRLQQLDKIVTSPAIQTTKDRVLRYVTLNEWNTTGATIGRRNGKTRRAND